MLMLFAPQNVSSGGFEGLRKNFLGSLSFAIFCGCLIYYAV